MAFAVAWCARQRGIACTVVVPEMAPDAKLAGIRHLGADIVKVSPEEFFETLSTRRKDGIRGTFVHAFSDARMMAGNGTIALEIKEDLPQVDAILVPQAIAPHVKVFACEPESRN